MQSGLGVPNKSEPLLVTSVDVLLAEIHAEVGLSGNSAYPFWYNKGDKICIIRGAQAQAKALHHVGPSCNVGYTYYNLGMQNISISQIMLEETPKEMD